MLEEWEYSAENLLYHFRSVFRGQTPFAQDSTQATDKWARADLDPESVVYMQKVAAIVKSRGKSSYRAHPILAAGVDRR